MSHSLPQWTYLRFQLCQSCYWAIHLSIALICLLTHYGAWPYEMTMSYHVTIIRGSIIKGSTILPAQNLVTSIRWVELVCEYVQTPLVDQWRPEALPALCVTRARDLRGLPVCHHRATVLGRCAHCVAVGHTYTQELRDTGQVASRAENRSL